MIQSSSEAFRASGCLKWKYICSSLWKYVWEGFQGLKLMTSEKTATPSSNMLLYFFSKLQHCTIFIFHILPPSPSSTSSSSAGCLMHVAVETKNANRGYLQFWQNLPMNPGGQLHEPLCLSHTPRFSQTGQVSVQPGPQKPSGHTVEIKREDWYSHFIHIIM